MDLKYTYRATFEGGAVFVQPRDDASVLEPTKSSKYDFLKMCEGRKIATFELHGQGRTYSVDHRTGQFAVNGVPVQIGGTLPDGVEWVHGDPAQGVYFRTVQIHLNAALEQVGRSLRFCFGVAAQPGVRNFLGVM